VDYLQVSAEAETEREGVKMDIVHELGMARDEEALASLNDWAVKTVREYARKMGYDAEQLVGGEMGRPGIGGPWSDYKKARRTGSPFRLTREVRKAVWAIYATRARFNAVNERRKITGEEGSKLEGLDGVVAHESRAAIEDRETGERWALCWVRVGAS